MLIKFFLVNQITIYQHKELIDLNVSHSSSSKLRRYL